MQADRLAARVMADAPPSSPPAEQQARDGTPLPGALREFYEPRFGRSLAHIRLHTGPTAQRAAHALRAHAFTLEHHVWLGREHAAAPSPTVAHELAHALHHDRHTVWREPYTTRGTALDRVQIAAMEGRSYWEQRTINTYLVGLDPRLTTDAEERDAVLSVLWSLNPPTTVTRQQVMVVPIAARALPAPAAQTGTQPTVPPPPPRTAPQLLYRFTFDRPSAGDPRPRLQVTFVASGAGVSPVAAPTVPAAYVPSVPNAWNVVDFPSTGTQPDDYWAAHPDEHRALFSWIENSAPASFSQLVTTRTEQQVRPAGTRITHRSAFHVSGSHSGSTISTLTIRLAGAVDVTAQQSAPADYRGHGDAEDFELGRLRARTPAANALGSVTLPRGLPADEVTPVKEAVRQYFESGRARNTEVDAIVPVGSGSRTVLYTIVYGAGNDVTVTRVGEAGSGAGQVDVNRVDVRRTRGFPGATAAPAQLRSWWSSRYAGAPALTSPATADAAALVTEMNGLVAAGIATASWFNAVYGIEVLDAAGITARLTSVHSIPAASAGGTVDFSGTDLRMLELALQTLTASELARLRGAKLGRKTAAFKRSGARYGRGDPGQYGITLTEPSGATTVVYFEPLYLNNERLFRGSGAANVLPDVAMGLLHELGHATFGRSGIETAFNAWLATTPQAAPTWYAATAGTKLFPEAWALYHTDPHFLCGRAPLLFAWLDALATSGSPPAAGATLTAPASCPP